MNKKHTEELNELQDSGKVNMMLTPGYLIKNYGYSKQEARKIFMEWKEQC